MKTFKRNKLVRVNEEALYNFDFNYKEDDKFIKKRLKRRIKYQDSISDAKRMGKYEKARIMSR